MKTATSPILKVEYFDQTVLNSASAQCSTCRLSEVKFFALLNFESWLIAQSKTIHLIFLCIMLCNNNAKMCKYTMEAWIRLLRTGLRWTQAARCVSAFTEQQSGGRRIARFPSAFILYICASPRRGIQCCVRFCFCFLVLWLSADQCHFQSCAQNTFWCASTWRGRKLTWGLTCIYTDPSATWAAWPQNLITHILGTEVKGWITSSGARLVFFRLQESN